MSTIEKEFSQNGYCIETDGQKTIEITYRSLPIMPGENKNIVEYVKTGKFMCFEKLDCNCTRKNNCTVLSEAPVKLFFDSQNNNIL